MNDAYDHALWLRRCQSPLEQRDRMLCDLGHYVSQLLAALEKGQENCDAVYDDLKAENAQLRALLGASLQDTERLDWLEQQRVALNAHCGSTYGWKLVQSHLVNRLMLETPEVAEMAGVDLHDTDRPGHDVRAAIDAVRKP